MGGGLIQLVAKGYQDIYITDNPQITFFKIVYRRHTNFSMEAIPQYFIHDPDFGQKSSCVLYKNGDLVGKTYLIIKLPEIPKFLKEDGSEDPYMKFAWVKKIGFALIKSIELEIDGKLIDKQYGDWINIWLELTKRKDGGLEKMIGDVEELTSFTNGKKEYTLYIPLQFWFCKYPGSYLPIVCMHHADIKINLELNDIDNCCLLTPTHYIELEDDIVGLQKGEYIEQIIGNNIYSGIFSHFDYLTKRLYYHKISKNKFVSLTYEDEEDLTDSQRFDLIFEESDYFIRGLTSKNFVIPRINCISKSYSTDFVDSIIQNLKIQKCYLLVNYIFLDEEERYKFIHGKHEYLIEQVHLISEKTITSPNPSIKIDSIHPCKLLVWFIQMTYLQNSNDTFNYTNSYNQEIGKSLVEQEGIFFNGIERISQRSYKYFNYNQNIQHFHTYVPEGVNLYSFSIAPTNFQPSGSCNMSYIGQTEIKLNLDHIINDTNTAKFKGYALGLNVLRIVDGLAGLVFIR